MLGNMAIVPTIEHLWYIA